MQRVWASMIALLMLSAQTYAQRTVTGIVKSGEETIVGATVYHESTNTGTVTDLEGVFELKNLPDSEITLLINYLGYTPKMVTVSASNVPITVELETDDLQLQDFVVTANKKTQSLQNVPMAITALSPVLLRRTGAKQFRDFASGIPNLSFGTQGSDGGGRYSGEISIRGISGINTTAMYLDETPLPESISPNLIDVSRVEVLKGPQGTLYGSATMAGAVKVVSNNPNPKQLEGSFGVSGSAVAEGDFNYSLSGVYNKPLSDKMAFRASGYYDVESGVYDRVINPNVEIINSEPRLTEDWYGDPIDVGTDGCFACSSADKENVDDKRNYGFNASLGLYPTENISIIPKIIHQQEQGDGYDFAEGDVNNFTQNSFTGINESFQDNWTHYSLGVNIGFERGKVVSSTSYLDRFYREVEDASEINAIWWLEYEDESIDEGDAIWASSMERSVGTKLFQQELRYESDFGGKFDILLGAFYRSEKEGWLYLDERPGKSIYLLSDNAYDSEECPDCAWDYDQVVNNPNTPWYLYDGFFDEREMALFGQFYYQVTPRLKATFGFRYFDANQKKNIIEDGADFGFDPLVLTDENKESSFNPKLNLNYQINPNQLFYATVVKGFRLGDINENVPSSCLEELEGGAASFPRFYNSDFIWNYELGFKGVWGGGKLVTNAALFLNQWNNLQQYRFLDCGWGYTSNVGAAQTTGFELDVRYKVVPELELSGGLGLMNPEITESGEFLEAEVGDRILFAPTITANAMANYYKDLGNEKALYATSMVQHVGERYGTYFPEEDEENVYPAYTLANGRIGMQFGKTDVSLFGNNLTNKQANFGGIQSFTGNVSGRPRFSTNRPRTIGVEARFYF